MAEHTSGPWTRSDLTVHTVGTREAPALKIAKVFDYGQTDAVWSPEEADANAQLMTAAPDLLKAAELALEKCPFPVGAVKAKVALEDAVAKAEGRA